MAQPIELILVRHLASSLALPTFLVDREGTLVFYNEAAEPLLGHRFDEAGAMAFDDWTAAYAVRDDPVGRSAWTRSRWSVPCEVGGRSMPASTSPAWMARRGRWR